METIVTNLVVNNVLEGFVIGIAEHVFQAVSQGTQEQIVVKVR